MADSNVLLMFQPLFWHDLHLIALLYTITDDFPWVYGSFQAQEHCLGFITASPTLGFLIRLSSISGQASQSCVALLVLVICDHPFSFTCNSPIFMWFTKFFLFVWVKCFQISFSNVFGYLISIKYLCGYSRTTEENHLSFILCEVSLSLVVILNILFICDFIYSAILCNPALFQCSTAIFDLSLCHGLSTQGASDFVNPNCITQCPTFVSPAVTHQSQVLVLYFCLVHCTLQASACISFWSPPQGFQTS